MHDKAAADDEVLIYGPIVSERLRTYYEEEGAPAMSALQFAARVKALRGEGVTDVKMRVNSPGGSVAEASAIRQRMSELQLSGMRFNAVIDGNAASAASIITLGSDEVTMAKLGQYYIHKPSQFMFGSYGASELADEARDLQDYAEVLELIYDDRGVDYSALGYSNASELAYGRAGNGTQILAPKAVKARLADRVESDNDVKSDETSNDAGDDAGDTTSLARQLRDIRLEEMSQAIWEYRS